MRLISIVALTLVSCIVVFAKPANDINILLRRRNNQLNLVFGVEDADHIAKRRVLRDVHEELMRTQAKMDLTGSPLITERSHRVKRQVEEQMKRVRRVKRQTSGMVQLIIKAINVFSQVTDSNSPLNLGFGKLTSGVNTITGAINDMMVAITTGGFNISNIISVVNSSLNGIATGISSMATGLDEVRQGTETVLQLGIDSIAALSGTSTG